MSYSGRPRARPVHPVASLDLASARSAATPRRSVRRIAAPATDNRVICRCLWASRLRCHGPPASQRRYRPAAVENRHSRRRTARALAPPSDQTPKSARLCFAARRHAPTFGGRRFHRTDTNPTTGGSSVVRDRGARRRAATNGPVRRAPASPPESPRPLPGSRRRSGCNSRPVWGSDTGCVCLPGHGLAVGRAARTLCCMEGRRSVSQ